MWYLPATVQVSSELLEVSDPSTTLTDPRRGTIPVVPAVGLPYLPSSLVTLTACVETFHHFKNTEWDREGWCASQYFLLCGTWYLLHLRCHSHRKPSVSLIEQNQEVGEGGGGLLVVTAAWHIVFIYYISGHSHWKTSITLLEQRLGGGGGYRPVVVEWHMVFTTSLVTALENLHHFDRTEWEGKRQCAGQ